MEMMEALKRALQEAVLPELGVIRAESAEIKSVLQLTNKRMDDIYAQLVDQSRRIDEVRTELSGRIDAARAELAGRIDETNKRIDETNKRIDAVHSDLIARNDETNRSLSRLYEVIVRRDEHVQLTERVARLEQGFQELRARVAA